MVVINFLFYILFYIFRYIIQVKHGKFKWTLEKRFKHFLNIRNHLDFHRAALVVKHPTMAGRLEKVPKLPMRPEVSLRSENSKTRRMRKLQKFLQCVLNIDKFRNYIHVLDFLGVSHLSFIEDLGAKQKLVLMVLITSQSPH